MQNTFLYLLFVEWVEFFINFIQKINIKIRPMHAKLDSCLGKKEKRKIETFVSLNLPIFPIHLMTRGYHEITNICAMK